MSESRSAELETTIAFQENTLQQLNEVVVGMQKQIDQLELTCKALTDRLLEVRDLLPDMPADEKPPHY